MEPLWFFLRMGGATLLATGVVLGAVHNLRKRSDSGGKSMRPRRLGSFAMAIGVLAGFLVRYGVPTSPFGSDSMRATDRLFFGLLLLGILGLSTWRRALSLGAIALPVIVIALFKDPAENVLPILGLALAGQILLEAGDWAIRLRTGSVGAIQVGFILAVVPAAIALSGTVDYAQSAGLVGVAFGLTSLAAWRNWDAGQLDGASAMLAVGAFALMATRYSELKPLHAGLLLGALPLSLLVTAKLQGRQALIGWLVLLAPVVATFVMIAMNLEPDPYAEWR